MPSPRALISLAVAVVLAACGHDWDQYQPQPSGTSSSSAAGGAGGGPTSSSSTGAAASNGGAGGQPAGPGGGPATSSTGGSAPWYDEALGRRRAVVIESVGGAALDDFPVLVELDPSHIDYAATADGGADVRFVADDQATLLAHDIDTWTTGGDSAVWVRLPQIPADGSTTIWLYHGGTPGQPPLPAKDTWSNGYEAVWHLGSGLSDATAHGHDGQPFSGVAGNAAGMIGTAYSFDGTNDYIEIPASEAIDALFVAGGTISAWIRPTSSGTSQRGRIFDRSLDATFSGGWAFLMSDYAITDSIGFAQGMATNFDWWTTPAGSIAYMTWQHVAVTFSVGDDAPKIYIDGAPAQVAIADGGGMGAPPAPAPIASRIGNRGGGTDRAFAGIIDEVRLSAVVRPAEWIEGEFRAGNGTLAAVGAEELR